MCWASHGALSRTQPCNYKMPFFLLALCCCGQVSICYKYQTSCLDAECSSIQQCITVQYSAVQWYSADSSTVEWCSLTAVQHSTVQYSTVQFSPVQTVVPYNGVVQQQYSTVQYSNSSTSSTVLIVQRKQYSTLVQ